MVMGFGNGYMNQVNAINPIGNPYANGMMGMGMMNPYYSQLNFSGSEDMTNYYKNNLNNYKTSIFTNGGGRTSQKTYAIANNLRGAIAAGNDTQVGMILSQLDGNKELMAGVELAYDNASGTRTALRQDLRNELGGDKSGLGFIADAWYGITSSVAKAFGKNPMHEKDAFRILNQGVEVSTTVAANAAKEAMLGFGTDGATLKSVLNTVDKNGSGNEFNMSYSQMGNLSHDINQDFHGIIDGFGVKEGLATRLTSSLI